MKVTERSIDLNASIKKSENEIKKIKECSEPISRDNLIKIIILKKYLEMDEAFLAIEELNVNKNR